MATAANNTPHYESGVFCFNGGEECYTKYMKTTLVIFGITGDLSTRKLLPTLESILLLNDTLELSVVGVSRRQVDLDDLMGDYPRLKERSEIFTMDLAEVGDYHKLAALLKEKDSTQTLHYLSVPPSAAATITDFLGEAGLNSEENRILFEKPFGFDLPSAEAFIARTEAHFNDNQLYRIDHYMAKEIASGIMKIRREASDPDLKKKVKRVSVIASEKIGIEGRAQFYEQTGALRDFVQGHLMQVLSLVLIRTPNSDPLPAQRLKALEQVKIADPEKAIRGQYEGYQEEAQNPGSTVETFVSLSLESTDPQWEGTELRLITGKALSEKRSYIHFEYEDGSERILDEDELLAASTERHLEAYERVLLEAIEGRKSIFTTGPEVLRSWKILSEVQSTWDLENAPLHRYQQGATLTDILK